MRRRRTAHRFGEKRRTTDVLIDEKVDFSGLMLSSDVLEGLKSAGFERPSPIQLKAIPLGRCGLDLIAQAKSGTGKTCVFSVIALENINLAVTSIQVLVLAPTREIAVQIKDVMCSIGQHLKGLQTHVFIGGMPLEDDKNRLKQCHIAIGTPGRIKHLIESKLLLTTSIRLFTLDEADKLLDESFQEQINWIYSTLPASKQMLALSATYPDHLAERLKNYMKDPTFVRLNAADPALEGVCHYRCVVPFHSLPHKVFQQKVESLLKLLSKLSFHQCLIFSNYQIRAKNLSETLAMNGWPSTYISGNQGQNERLNAMAKLKEFKCRILISTDLTSRGIDAERVNLVINMDLPHDSETYLHRVGRAGRFGSYGVAVNFVAEGKEVTSLNEIAANCGVTITSLPDDVSKLLSEEVMDQSQKSSGTHEVKSLNEVECKETNNINVNTQEAFNSQQASIVNNEETTVNHQIAENRIVENEATGNIEQNDIVVVKEIENSNQHTDNEMKANKEVKVDLVQETNNKMENIQRVTNIEMEVNKEVPIENQAAEYKVEHTVEHTEEAVESEKKINGHNDAEKLFDMSDIGSKLEITPEGRNDLKENMTDNNNSGDTVINESGSKIFFRNHDTNLFPTVEQLNGEDLVSDESGSEFSSSEETGSSEESCDSHVPISCKDFDNVFKAYLKGHEGGYSKNGKNNLENKSHTLHQSLKTSVAEDANDDNEFGASSDAINANEVTLSRSEIKANARAQNAQSLKSHISKDANDCKTIVAQGDVNYANDSRPLPRETNANACGQSPSSFAQISKDPINCKTGAQEDGIYANETSRDFAAPETNNGQNPEEAMFYGATPDDVISYIAELPAEWTNTWYRVYDRQTKFIMKYTKICHENF